MSRIVLKLVVIRALLLPHLQAELVSPQLPLDTKCMEIDSQVPYSKNVLDLFFMR